MKALLIIIMFSGSLVNVLGNNEPTVDTNNIYLADSLTQGMDISDGIESNFDSNLDSTLNLYYVKNSVNIDSLTAVEINKIIPSFSDSVYKARLAAIPTEVELTYNSIVRAYIDTYTKRKRGNVEVMLGLSEHYFPIFDDIFDYYDVPNEMKYMSIIESALNPRALSRTRAVGLWQFMYGTGRVYGLEINSLVDERRDTYKSTHAAAKFARDLYNIYGDWILVIAAYNCGPGNVNKAIRRSGGKTNYWDIYYYLPRETRGHVPAFIAATYMMNYYSEHNLTPAKVDIPLITDTVLLSQPLHLKQVSAVLNIPIEQLRDLNPQYREDIIPMSIKKRYALTLPENTIETFIDQENLIYAFKDSVYFSPDKLTSSPNQSPTAAFIPEAPGKNFTKLLYTVQSGDNLGFISTWYDVRITDLKYWNNINRNVIRAGQKIAIYKNKNVAEKYRPLNEMSFAQKQSFSGKPTTVSASSTTSAPVLAASGSTNYVMYTVRSGDTLWDIAKKFPGTTDTEIMRLNNLSNYSKIQPGQKLKIKPQ